MRIYYKILGGHVHCRVFTKGKNGDLVFSLDEWEYVPSLFFSSNVQWIKEEE